MFAVQEADAAGGVAGEVNDLYAGGKLDGYGLCTAVK